MTILLIIFIALQIGDGVSTWLALRSGKGREANPVIRWLMGLIGVAPSLVLFKALAIALGVMAIRVEYGAHALAALSAIYGWVLWNNLRTVFRSAP